jgi:hypothetical protein
MTPDEIARTMPEWPESGWYPLPGGGVTKGYILFVSDTGAVLDYDFNYEFESPIATVNRPQLRSYSGLHDDDEFDDENYLEIMDDATKAGQRPINAKMDANKMEQLLSLVGIDASQELNEYKRAMLDIDQNPGKYDNY